MSKRTGTIKTPAAPAPRIATKPTPETVIPEPVIPEPTPKPTPEPVIPRPPAPAPHVPAVLAPLGLEDSIESRLTQIEAEIEKSVPGVRPETVIGCEVVYAGGVNSNYDLDIQRAFGQVPDSKEYRLVPGERVVHYRLPALQVRNAVRKLPGTVIARFLP